MISKHSVFVILFGWLLAGAYVYYDYTYHQGYTFDHFLSAGTPGDIFFHVIILITITGAHITGHLINVRKKLLIKTIDSEKKLKHAAHEWMVTFDSIPYGIMLTDPGWNIIRANKYIADLYGIPVKELISGWKCHELICDKNRPAREYPCSGMDSTYQTASHEYYDHERGIIFHESITPKINKDGKLSSYIHVLIDITDVKEKETKLMRSKDAFFNMLKDLDSAYKELKEIHNSLIITFSNIIDAKSSWTRGHSIDVANYAIAIAREMGLDDRDIETLRTAALLHDIGKVGTYDIILDKPDKLNNEERDLIRFHTVKGQAILSPIKGFKSIIPIVRSHHERVDGTGYPDGLTGDHIHPLAKILCVADSYDAMISNRPYRHSQGRDYAMTELKRCSGTQFDSNVAGAFLSILGRAPGDSPAV